MQRKQQPRQFPKHLHLGCGQDYRPDCHNVDVVNSVDSDEVVDLDNYPWPWPDNSFRQITANHVFEHLEDIEQALRQCSRLLVPGGKLEIAMPLGANAIADPDHKHVWTWQTPDFYCGKRHWDRDVGLDVVKKSVNMHSQYPWPVARLLQRAKWDIIETVAGPGEWMTNQPAMSGELQVVFRR